MNKILFVGEHPFSFTGNGHMMAEIMRHVDTTKFDVSVFAGSTGIVPDAFQKADYPIIEGGYDPSDFLGSQNLIRVLSSLPEVHAVVFVGLDLWAYVNIYPQLLDLKRQKNFKWVSIFPYDQIHIRQDYLDWLAAVDFPCVYSQYGFDLLSPHIKNVRYFRPPLYDADKFIPFDDRRRNETRRRLFPSCTENDFIFGFFGNNQIRKDPQRLLHCFFKMKQEHKPNKNTIIYLHTAIREGNYNLEQYIRDCNSEPGDVFVMKQGFRYNTDSLVEVYNSVDCYVTASLQEGLNWTIVEAMLCGTPVIASATTAHHELLKEGAGIAIPCTDLAYTPVRCERGDSWVETRSINIESMVLTMESVVNNSHRLTEYKERGLLRAKEWLAGVSDINALLTEVCKEQKVTKITPKKKDVLFAQHSSAGDVLMTTQCFKGIKERHPNKKLIYMTQKKFQDIIVNNPYIDEIIDWNDHELKNYEIVYNPHGEHILPGGFNSLDVTLYSLYPYFCKVKPDVMFIEKSPIDIELPDEFIVVHTTGGDVEFRTYPHMDLVIKLLNLSAVQIGGSLDMACDKAVLDLRGKLSFRETAYVMSKAKLVIAIDSFPAHLAGHLGVPTIVLFGPAPARVTRPRDDFGKVVHLEPNKLDVCDKLTNCWGEFRDCKKPCIHTINPRNIVSAAKRLLKGV